MRVRHCAVLLCVALLALSCTPRGKTRRAAARGDGGGVVVATAPAPASAPALDTAGIETALRMKGALADGVFRVAMPRDLGVTLDGFTLSPRMGLTAWMAFHAHGTQTMVMGDLPLLADELQPVIAALVDADLEVTAVHNHFVGEEPRLTFVHVGGVGDTIALARGLRDALDAIVRIRAAKPALRPAPEVRSSLEPGLLDTALARHGELDAGVYRVSVPRAAVHPSDLTPAAAAALGFDGWAAFQGSPARAAVAGDLALLPGDVAGVVAALREHHIAVVALHNHMLTDDPRLFFVHFWGVGRADDLARGLRAALDRLPPG